MITAPKPSRDKGICCRWESVRSPVSPIEKSLTLQVRCYDSYSLNRNWPVALTATLRACVSPQGERNPAPLPVDLPTKIAKALLRDAELHGEWCRRPKLLVASADRLGLHGNSIASSPDCCGSGVCLFRWFAWLGDRSISAEQSRAVHRDREAGERTRIRVTGLDADVAHARGAAVWKRFSAPSVRDR